VHPRCAFQCGGPPKAYEPGALPERGFDHENPVRPQRYLTLGPIEGDSKVRSLRDEI
jgi:hypothetical protein